MFPDGKIEIHPLDNKYLINDALDDFLKKFRVEGNYNNYCGLFGYTAFDSIRYMENIPVMEYHHVDTDAPDMYYILYKYLLVFDHFNNQLTLIELCSDAENDHLNEIEALIENRNFASYDFRAIGKRTSSITDDEYRAMVRQGIQHCQIGRAHV